MSAPVISLSTSYLQSKFKDDGYAMLAEAAEMGFEYVELGHSTPVTAVDGILRALGEEVVKVSSLHNFCPLPPYVKGSAPNLYSPATRSQRESEQWLRHTKNTMLFAQTTGARAVVCHAGKIKKFLFQPESAIFSYRDSLDDGFELDALADDKMYLKIRDRFLRRVRGLTQKGYANIVENFKRLYAEIPEAQRSVACGVENREDPQDLPADWDFEEFAKLVLEVPQVGLWHDVGHSKKKEQLQLGRQLDLIERTADRIIGWHLHDCSKSGRDHIAIGRGDIDFKPISKFFDPEKHIFTLEINSSVAREDAVDSLSRVRDMF